MSSDLKLQEGQILPEPSKRELVSMVRKELTIGDKTVLAFMDAQGLYYLNSTQVAKLIDKKANAVEGYVIQNALSSLSRNEGVEEMRLLYRNGLGVSRSWDFTVFVENGNNQPYRVLPIKNVVDFAWFHMDKGDRLARDLVYMFSQESLEIRLECLFVGVSPNVEEIIKQSDNWIRSRQYNQSVHHAFQTNCLLNNHPANHVHDRMTLHVFGQTAKQAITSNPLVGSDESIGLDYQDNVEGQLMMAKMKLKFIGYKKGTWKQKVDKAYLDCIG
jgi:hypothetical protein